MDTAHVLGEGLIDWVVCAPTNNLISLNYNGVYTVSIPPWNYLPRCIKKKNKIQERSTMDFWRLLLPWSVEYN